MQCGCLLLAVSLVLAEYLDLRLPVFVDPGPEHAAAVEIGHDAAVAVHELDADGPAFALARHPPTVTSAVL